MELSRCSGAALAVLAGSAMACDSILGLSDYHDVACAFDCDSGNVADAGDEPKAEVRDAGAADTSLATNDTAAPSLHEIWAHWPMPNPDASIAPGASAFLPNPMTYNTGADGGDMVVQDLVTSLAWYRTSLSASSASEALGVCGSIAGGWRMPTRIELVSLIDFTRPASQATVDPGAFPGVVPAVYWTASVVPNDGGAAMSWLVSFADGHVFTGQTGAYVLCVRGGDAQ